jgi:hypothetical protein
MDKQSYRRIQVEMQAYLAERFEDARVEIGDDIHYQGTNIVITSRAFEGLLPEQRFHHVVRAIPPSFYDQHLRRAGVWFELAPGETGRDLMRMPRSEDIADREDEILELMNRHNVFEQLRTRLAASLPEVSIDDFIVSRRVLVEAGFDQRETTQACLFLIRRGAFCDIQVLVDVLPKFAAEPTGRDVTVDRAAAGAPIA